MPFIVFNTLAKAQHYVNYCNYEAKKHNSFDNVVHYSISGNKVIRENSYEWFCGSSEPDNGYICCSDTRYESIVIGRIKKLSK